MKTKFARPYWEDHNLQCVLILIWHVDAVVCELGIVAVGQWQSFQWVQLIQLSNTMKLYKVAASSWKTIPHPPSIQIFTLSEIFLLSL